MRARRRLSSAAKGGKEGDGILDLAIGAHRARAWERATSYIAVFSR
jgi:hypothetical protein